MSAAGRTPARHPPHSFSVGNGLAREKELRMAPSSRPWRSSSTHCSALRKRGGTRCTPSRPSSRVWCSTSLPIRVAVAAHPGLEPRHQFELPPHQLQAAAHGGLVHGQGCGGPLLRLGELEQIEDVQVGQGRWRLIAGRRGGHGRHHESAASLRTSAAARGVALAKDGSWSTLARKGRWALQRRRAPRKSLDFPPR